MKIVWIQVGKNNTKFIQEGCDHYVTILKKYAHIDIVTLPEGNFSHDQRISKERKAETERIERAIPKDYVVVYLDVEGKSMDTHAFARYMEEVQSVGGKVCFVIGGAYGVDPSLYTRVDIRLSCSPMTTSHQMIRLFFFEQLFRVLSINAGSTYHHD